jgi:hypothetical protein
MLCPTVLSFSVLFPESVLVMIVPLLMVNEVARRLQLPVNILEVIISRTKPINNLALTIVGLVYQIHTPYTHFIDIAQFVNNF